MPSIKGKKVLVTGGAGFIGSHLCDELLEKGAEKVVCLDNFFLGKMENLEDALKHKNFVLYRDDARNFGVLEAILKDEEIVKQSLFFHEEAFTICELFCKDRLLAGSTKRRRFPW